MLVPPSNAGRRRRPVIEVAKFDLPPNRFPLGQSCISKIKNSCLWDGESKGTRSNTQNVIVDGEKARVYFSPDKTFCKPVSAADRQALVRRCKPELIADAQLRIANAGVGSQLLLVP